MGEATTLTQDQVSTLIEALFTIAQDDKYVVHGSIMTGRYHKTAMDAIIAVQAHHRHVQAA